MKAKELSKLSRLELLEMLIEQSKEVERLSIELNQAKQELEKREIILSQAGSIAEASLQLSGIFEAAQSAANQYINNVRLMDEQHRKSPSQIQEESIQEAKTLIQRTREECEELKEETRRQCKLIVQKARQDVQDEWLAFNRYKQSIMHKK